VFEWLTRIYLEHDQCVREGLGEYADRVVQNTKPRSSAR